MGRPLKGAAGRRALVGSVQERGGGERGSWMHAIEGTSSSARGPFLVRALVGA